MSDVRDDKPKDPLANVMFESAEQKAACEADQACRKLVADSSHSIFKVVSDKMSGTGWLGPDGRVITDEHIVHGASQVVAIGQDGIRHRLGGNVTIDPATDLAALGFADKAPSDAKPLKLAPHPPAPGEPMYSLNHSNELPLQLQKGVFRDTKTGAEVFAEQDKQGNFERHLSSLEKVNPAEAAYLREQLKRKFDNVSISTTHGGSGGPLFNQSLEVSSVVDRGAPDGKTNMTTPAADIGSTLAKPTTHISEYRSGLNYYLQTGSRSEILTSTAQLGTAGLAGAGLYGRPRGVLAPLVAGGLIVNQGAKDISRYLESGDRRDQIKYGLASGSDLLMGAGLATKMLSRNGALGLGMLGVGLAARLATELVPNELVLKPKQ